MVLGPPGTEAARIRKGSDIDRVLSVAIDTALTGEKRRHRRLRGLGAIATGAALTAGVQVARRRHVMGVAKLGMKLADMPHVRDVSDALRDRLADLREYDEPAEDEYDEDEPPEDEYEEDDLPDDEYEDDESPEDEYEDDDEDYEDEDEETGEEEEDEDSEEERVPAVAGANGHLDPADLPPEPPAEEHESE